MKVREGSVFAIDGARPDGWQARVWRGIEMSSLQYFLVSAVVVTAIGGWIDWRTGQIPNWLTLGALCVAPLAHFVLPLVEGGAMGWHSLQSAGASLLGAVLSALVPLVLYRVRAIGGGDVKLLAALGAILKPLPGIEAEFYAFSAAALIAPAWLAYEGKLFRVLGNTLRMALNPLLAKSRRHEVPSELVTSLRFGPAIFLGTCAAALAQWGPL